MAPGDTTPPASGSAAASLPGRLSREVGATLAAIGVPVIWFALRLLYPLLGVM